GNPSRIGKKLRCNVMNRTLRNFYTMFFAMLAWVFVVSLGCQKAERPVVGLPEGTPVPAPMVMEPGAEVLPFTLTAQDGEPFDSKSLAGKVWMGSVFFANCPGPCFRENQAVAEILREIDDPDFMAISLTCDPDNDTPDVLRRYADRFEADSARWKFLTGDFAVIKKLANESFLLPAEVGVHSERGVVFDRQGRLRGSYHLLQEDRVELLKKLIREVLAEEEPAS
ncbi:MAG: SCO family protein, partial [Planctomycetota bacterium]|nr:SCO family protein [Planctomycetota bacterium]